MVFQQEAQFQQFLHCKFRENIIRLLYIPMIPRGHAFLAVNKYGKVGLYDPVKLTLIHAYLLDMSVPMHAEMSGSLQQMAKRKPSSSISKCERTHLVVDAIYARDIQSVVFATTKNILQWYDIGEITEQSIGLEILPCKRFMNLKWSQSPVPLHNKGHVETHRLFGLSQAPSCMEYSMENTTTIVDHNVQITGKSASKLIIGDVGGGIAIITIQDPMKPLGRRKIRGVLHNVNISDLILSGQLKSYKAHEDPVKEMHFLSNRQLLLSCSRDRKFSLFAKDFSGTTDPYIISLPKGVNTFAHSDSLKLIATGSDDGILRLFNQFVLKMPQMELLGHKSSIIAVEFIHVAFSSVQMLVSFSDDVELRAWDPTTFVCLQSLYISFPAKSTIMCNTPEFAKKALIVHQPLYQPESSQKQSSSGSGMASVDFTQSESKSRRMVDSREDQHGHDRHSFEEDSLKKHSTRKSSTNESRIFSRGQDGFLIILYCNSYAKLHIERENSHWPFDFEDFIVEFEEMSSAFERKVRYRQQAQVRDPHKIRLTEKELEEIEANVDPCIEKMMEIKRRVDSRLKTCFFNPDQMTLSEKATKRLHFNQKMNDMAGTDNAQTFYRQHGVVFKNIPLHDLETISLSKNLPITSGMRRMMKADEIISLADLSTRQARKYFSRRNLAAKATEAKLTAKALSTLDTDSSANLNNKTSHEGNGKTFSSGFKNVDSRLLSAASNNLNKGILGSSSSSSGDSAGNQTMQQEQQQQPTK